MRPAAKAASDTWRATSAIGACPTRRRGSPDGSHRWQGLNSSPACADPRGLSGCLYYGTHLSAKPPARRGSRERVESGGAKGVGMGRRPGSARSVPRYCSEAGVESGRQGARATRAAHGAREGRDALHAALQRRQLLAAALEHLQIARVLAIRDIHVAQLDLDKVEQHFHGTL